MGAGVLLPTMDNNFQRIGSVSNAAVGREFEVIAEMYFRGQGIELRRGLTVPVGVGGEKKERKFDLGSVEPPVLVECKSHRWTTGGNVPSAKMTVWNEAMYYFLLAPESFRKILFVLRDFDKKRRETLATYYVRTYPHLIPADVEVLEFDPERGSVTEVTKDEGL